MLTLQSLVFVLILAVIVASFVRGMIRAIPIWIVLALGLVLAPMFLPRNVPVAQFAGPIVLLLIIGYALRVMLFGTARKRQCLDCGEVFSGRSRCPACRSHNHQRIF